MVLVLLVFVCLFVSFLSIYAIGCSRKAYGMLFEDRTSAKPWLTKMEFVLSAFANNFDSHVFRLYGLFTSSSCVYQVCILQVVAVVQDQFETDWVEGMVPGWPVSYHLYRGENKSKNELNCHT
jgi:hypothetical protein